MRRILLLLFLVSAINCKAQQKELDSLSNELKKHPREDTIKLNLLNKIAENYSYINTTKGLEAADAAIALANKLNSKHKLIVAILNKAFNYDADAQDSLALLFYTQALIISRQLNLKSLSAKILHDIGIFYFNRSRYVEAMQNQKQALSIFNALKDSLNAAYTITSIGIIYQYLSDYPEALINQQKALHILSKLGNIKGMADSYTNTGLIYEHLNNYPKALSYHHEALKIYEQTDNKQKIGGVFDNIANVYSDMNDSANAILYYQKALNISTMANYKYGIASATSNIGTFYYDFSDYLKALPYLKKAILLMQELNDQNNQAEILIYTGNVYVNASDQVLSKLNIKKADRFKTAIEYEQKALNIAKEIQVIEKQVLALQSLSNIYEEQANYKQAFATYKQAQALNDSLLNDDKKQQITRLEMTYQFDKTKDSIKVINDKQQIVAAAEIQKQKVIKNATMAGTGFLILAGIGGFIFYKRNRDIKLQRNEAELNQQVTDTEMKALRAQMNPHFIFNSLNSIADYIDKNQTQIASDFTAKFARLMRMVLENSEQKEISLAADLKALELYIQLERLRLKNKFSYTIKVDENIDTENTLVPPLILQPFVENSIWHGIAKKEGNGHINIYIQQQGEMINCIVEDDGGGIRETNYAGEEKKSLGMKITQSRIDVINKLKNANASIKILNKESGVRAEVKLPLELSF